MSADTDSLPEAIEVAPTFESLSSSEMAVVERQRLRFLQAVERNPDARFEDFLHGVTGDAYRVLYDDLVVEEYDHRQQLAARAAAETIRARRAGDPLIETALSRRTVAGSPLTDPIDLPPDRPADPSGPPDGFRVYGYEVRGVLSDRGSTAVVYRAFDRNTRREVALKVLRREQWETGEGLERFRQEVRLQAGLGGRGVPVVYATGFADGGWPYIAMELVEGNSLSARLPDPGTPFAFDPALVLLVRTLAAAVGTAHRPPHGICHLDLGPQNVHVVSDDRVVVLDWGLGRDRASPEATRDGGTPDFSAPEKARGQTDRYGPWTDVFSLGCYLIHALTGRGLFPDVANAGEKLARAARGDLSEPRARLRAARGVPGELVELALDCLEVEPERRPADAGIVAERIDAYFKSVEAERQEQRARAIRRRYVRIGLAVFLVVAGTAAALVRHSLHRAAEAQAKERFAETAAAGNQAAEAGRWHEARLRWQTVLTDPRLDEPRRLELRLRILRAAQFLNDRDAVRAELDALERDPGARELRGRLAFERAVFTLTPAMEYAFADPARIGADENPYETEVLALLQQVADDPTVPEADRLTARGMLARTADKAIGYYQEALALQPFHPYAGPYYLVTCLVAGRLQQALDRASVWAEAMPEDPLPWVYKAFVLTLQRRYTEADESLQRLARAGGGGRQLPLATLRACEAHVQAAREIDAGLFGVAGSPSGPAAAKARDEFVAAFKKSLGGANETDAGASVLFALPLPPHQRRAAGRFLAAATTLDHHRALSDLTGVDDFVSPGTVDFVRALLLLATSRQHDAAVMLRKCADSPHRWWDLRPICWLALANYNLSMARQPENAAAAMRFRNEAKDYLRLAAREVAGFPALAAKALSLAEQVGDPEFVEELNRVLQPNRLD